MRAAGPDRSHAAAVGRTSGRRGSSTVPALPRSYAWGRCRRGSVSDPCGPHRGRASDRRCAAARAPATGVVGRRRRVAISSPAAGRLPRAASQPVRTDGPERPPPRRLRGPDDRNPCRAPCGGSPAETRMRVREEAVRERRSRLLQNRGGQEADVPGTVSRMRLIRQLPELDAAPSAIGRPSDRLLGCCDRTSPRLPGQVHAGRIRDDARLDDRH